MRLRDAVITCIVVSEVWSSCAQAFKVQFVTSYMERLLRLADNATLRSELAQFPLAVDAGDAILPEHRAGVDSWLCPMHFEKFEGGMMTVVDIVCEFTGWLHQH